MEKLKAYLEAEKALLSLKESWYKCLIAFSNIYIDSNDYMSDKYPFNKSFDEIETMDWIDVSLENLKPLIQEEKRNVLFEYIHESVPFLEHISDCELLDMDKYEDIVNIAKQNLRNMSENEIEKIYEEWFGEQKGE